MLYVARGTAGVAVFDVTEPLSPRRVREVRVTGSATGFHVVDGQVWVVTVSRAMVPLDETLAMSATPASLPSAAPGAPASPSEPPPPAGPALRAAASVEIHRVSPGMVELGVGTTDGARVGDRFAIFRARTFGGDQGTGFAGEELVTVAEIVAVKAESALAETGRSAIVRTTDDARAASSDQRDSIVFPPRVPEVGEASFVLRPLVNAGAPLGVGILADLEASYWGPSYFADVRIQPLGLGWTTDGTIVSTAALLEGGYDARAFAVGLGVGPSWVNGDLDHMLQGFGSSDASSGGSPGTPTQTQQQETHAALTLSQIVRLGARDGLNLSVRNLLLLHHDATLDRSGFIYGGTTGRLAIPIAGRSDLFLEGGGGRMGYWFAGIGVSTWIAGNGSPGSWKLSVSAGGAGISGSKQITTTYPAPAGQPPQTSTYDSSIDIAGPMVSFGLTRRFAL